MTIALFDQGLRVALLAIVGLALLGSFLSARLHRSQLAAILTIVAFFSGGALLLELLASLLVRGMAGDAADFNEYRWVLLSPWERGALWLGVLAGVSSIALTALSTRRMHAPWRWAAVVGLRTAGVLTGLVLFVQPAVELRQVAREPNRVAILVDTSLSMELSDKKDAPSRREGVAKLIRESADTLAAWRKDHILDIYSFSTDLARTSLDALGQAPSTGKATLLRQALEKIRRQYDGDELAGIITISDGAVTGDLAELGTGELREFAQGLDAPVHTVWAAKPGLKDLAVWEVRADEFAFVRTVTRVEAVIHSSGYDKRKIPVTLSSDGKAMRRKWIEIGPGESNVSVVFEFTPPHVGKYVYKVSVPVEDDEVVAENNSAWFVVRVIRDKIRVLQVAGQPSWDVRALRGMLKQNPNVDLISFFILRTEDDVRKADNSELSLIPFPTRELFEEELPSFDLIVLQNFNYGPYGIGRYLENIRSYVEGGGGLMMLGGPLSFASGLYGGTPIARALPVELASGGSASELLDVARFRPVLTELGDIHPVTALRYEAGDNRSAWQNLPPLEGVNKVLRAKKDAAVLAVHPTLKDSDQQAMPVIVAMDYGEGRSLAVMTDSLWRWGFVAAADPGNDGRHYLKLWDNAIRWLIQDPELRYLHVDSDRNSYAPDSTVRLNVRLFDQDYSPLKGGEVTLAISKGFDPEALEAVQTQTLKVGDAGEASLELEHLPAGVYRVEGEATVRGRKVQAQDIFLVHEASTEHLRPAPQETVLRSLSELSGGAFLGSIARLPEDLPFIAPKVVRVDKRKDVALWSLPWLLLCALLFLGLEWLLRQRGGSL